MERTAKEIYEDLQRNKKHHKALKSIREAYVPSIRKDIGKKEYDKYASELYRSIPANKEKTKIYARKYNQKPEVKAKRKEYLMKPEVKERLRKYYIEYNLRPEVQKRLKKYYKDYWQRPGVKERKNERNRRIRNENKNKIRGQS